MAELHAKDVGESAERGLPLWIGMLLPPVAWAVQVQALWLTSEYACNTANFLWNHVVSVVALVVSAAGGLVAYIERKKLGPKGSSETNDDPVMRRRFMAMIGILTGALFTMVIFAQWLPTLLGVPCSK